MSRPGGCHRRVGAPVRPHPLAWEFQGGNGIGAEELELVSRVVQSHTLIRSTALILSTWLTRCPPDVTICGHGQRVCPWAQ